MGCAWWRCVPDATCVANSIVASQPSRTVGAKKLPGRPPLLPPTTTCASRVGKAAFEWCVFQNYGCSGCSGNWVIWEGVQHTSK
eukprot:scaffold27569_cov67-Isochrysis_galbana.AAC.1